MLTFAGPAAAGDDWRQVCKTWSETGGTVMRGRQNGAPMSRMMDAAGDSSIAQAIVMDAYKQPRYQTEDMQKKSVEDFTNTVYMGCANGMKK
jgi:hypothetical protein